MSTARAVDVAALEAGDVPGGVVEVEIGVHRSPRVTRLAARLVARRVRAASPESLVVGFTTTPTDRLAVELPPLPLCELAEVAVPLAVRIGEPCGLRYVNGVATVVLGADALRDSHLAAMVLAAHRRFDPCHCEGDRTVEALASGAPGGARHLQAALREHEDRMLGELLGA